MGDLVFFYGTLMSGFQRPGRIRLDHELRQVGRGWIHGALFDLGIYPAAVPATDTRIWGEVHQMTNSVAVLAELDEIEGYSAEEPDSSLYIRRTTSVMLEDGRSVDAWAYFYNAPLGRAERIESGDYLEHLKIR